MCDDALCQTLTGDPLATSTFGTCSGTACVNLGFCSSIIPLPVELVEFTGKQVSKEAIILQWKTVSELDNQGFQIERSTDGDNWMVLDFINGVGSTIDPQQYEYTDGDIQNFTYYYRLKQIDFGGTYSYSNIISIEVNGELNGQIAIYPNPVRDVLYIRKVTGIATLFSIDGRKISEKVLGGELFDYGTGFFTLSDISAGIYILKIVSEQGQTFTHQIIKR